MSNICAQIIRNHKRFQLNSIRGKRISRYVRLNYADDFTHTIIGGGAKVAVLTGALALMGGVLPSHVLASDLPTGGKVISGKVDITQDATNMNLNQSTDKAVVDWDSFDIGSGNTVQFHQPSTSSVALNRVVGSSSASYIYGKLDANGQVFVINPNGVLVGAGGVIHAAGLLASTLDISNNDFLAGRYSFDGPASIASIVNQGRVTADDYVVLAAPHVSNAGNILAKVVHLTAANAYTLNFAGNDLIGIVIDNAAADSLVSNSGTIESNGGRVVMAASSASDMLKTVVNNTGVIHARSLVEGENGEIILSGNGGDVVNTGILDASGVNGGAISVSGDRVANAGTMSADALSGDGGSINIHADNTVALSTGSRISANAGTNGDGGSVIVFSPDTVLFRDGATIESKGGRASGDGGFVEVSGLKHVEINGFVDASATNGVAGTFLIDPTTISVVDSLTLPEITDDADGTFTHNDDFNDILASLIESYLDTGTNVTLDTGSVHNGNGDIRINAAIEKTGANSSTLTLIANNDIIVNQTITSANDSLSMNFTASNNITINAPIDAHGGIVTMTASGAIVGDGAVDVDVTAGTLVINGAGNVGTGTGNNALTTDVENIDISGVDNSIYIHQNSAVAGSLSIIKVTNTNGSSGDEINIHSGQDAMVVGVINADSGLDEVVLSSNNNILDGNSDLNNVIASSLTIGEANDIGVSDDVMETMIDSLLMGKNVAGDVYIKNQQALTIEGDDTVIGGSLVIESTDSITNENSLSADTMTIKATGSVTNTSSGTISAVDTVSITANQISQNGNISVDSGIVTLNSTTTITDNTDEANYINAGTLNITLATNVGADTGTDNSVDSTWLDIDVNTLNVSNVTGASYINEVSGINLASVSTDGDFMVHAAGTITASSVTVTDDEVQLTSRGGSILVDKIDAGTAGTVDLDATWSITDYDAGTDTAISAEIVELDATSGVGTDTTIATDGTLEIDADFIIANNTATVGIFLNAVGTNGVGINASATGIGNIEIYGTEEVTLTDVDTTAGIITALVTGADLIAEAVDGAVDATDATTIVSLSTVNTGDVIATHVSGVNAGAGKGNISITSAGNISVDSIDAGDDVTLSAIGDIVGDGAEDVDVIAETLLITDATNVGTVNGALITDVENIDISGVENSIYIHQNSAVAGSLSITTVTNTNGSSGDVINIHSGQDVMEVGTINADSGLDDVVLSSNSNILDSNLALNNVTASSLTIEDANNIGAADDVMETMIDSLLMGENVVGDVYIKNLQALTIEGDDTVIGGSLGIESTGSITNENSLSADTMIIKAAGGVINTGTITAVDTVSITARQISQNGMIDAGTVTLSSTTTITDDTDEANYIKAGTLNITSATNVGVDTGADNNVDSTWLDIDVDTLNVRDVTGASYINEINSIDLASVSSDGDFMVHAAGDITASSVTVTDEEVQLTSGGSIFVKEIDAGTAGTVDLNATGRIIDDDAGTEIDISAETVELDAVDGVGTDTELATNGALDINADSITANNTGTVGIFLNAVGTDGVGIVASETGSNNIEIYGTEEVTLTDVDTTAGTITAQVTGADLIAVAVDGAVNAEATTVVSLSTVNGNVIATHISGENAGAGTGNVSITTTDGNVIVNGLVSTDGELKIITNGASPGSDITLNHEVIADDRISLIAGEGDISLQGVDTGTLFVSLNGVTTLNGDIKADTKVDLENAQNIDLVADINIIGDGSTDVLLTGGDVTGDYNLRIEAGSGHVILNKDIAGLVDVNKLTVIASGQTEITGNIKTDDGMDFSGAENVDITAATILTNSESGSIDLTGGAVDGSFELTINAEDTDIELGDMGQGIALGTGTGTALDVNTTGIVFLGGNITTDDGVVDFSGAKQVILRKHLTIDTSNNVASEAVGDQGANIIFSSGLEDNVNSLKGAFGLRLDAGDTGNINFDSIFELVGNGDPAHPAGYEKGLMIEDVNPLTNSSEADKYGANVVNFVVSATIPGGLVINAKKTDGKKIVSGGDVVMNQGDLTVDSITVEGNARIIINATGVDGSGDVTINGMLSASGGDIEIQAFNDIEINNTVASTYGDITMMANGDIIIGDDGLVVASSSSSTVSLTANYRNGGGVDASASVAGSAIVDASTIATNKTKGKIEGGTIILTVEDGFIGGGANVAGTVTMDDSALEIDARTRLDVDLVNGGELTASRSVVVTDITGDLPVGLVDAGNSDVTLIANGGSITDNNAGADNIEAGDLIVKAAGDINLDTSIDSINVESLGRGNINIDEANALIVNSAKTADGTIDIAAEADGVLSVISIDAGNDDVTLSAIGAIEGDGAVDVDVTAGTLVINDAGNVGTGAGNLALTTDVDHLDISGVENSIYIHQNSVVAGILRVDRVTNGDDSSGDVINIHSGQDAMVVGVINADSGLDEVVLSSASNISDSNSDLINVTASSLTIEGADNIGVADDVIETMVDSLLMDTNVVGDVYIKNLQALTIGGESTEIAGSLDIESTGSITNDSLTSAETMTIKAAGDVTNTSNGILSANDIVITANQISQNGNITAGTVTLNSTTTITDDTDDAGYINAETLNISATNVGSDTGADNDADSTWLDTDVDTLNVRGVTGSSYINELGEIDLASVSTGGDFVIQAAGNITASSVTVIDAEVQLSSVDSIFVKEIDAGTAGTVDLDAITIIDVDAGTGIDISAGTVELDAVDGVGTDDGALEIDADFIMANNTGTTGIFLNAAGTDGVGIDASATGTGNIEIYGTEDVTLTDVDTTAGTITAQVTGADLIAGAVDGAVNAGDATTVVSLSTVNTGNVIATHVSGVNAGAGTGNVSITSADNVLTGTNDDVADVEADDALIINATGSIGTGSGANMLEVEATTLDLIAGNGGMYVEDLGTGQVSVIANSTGSGDILMTSAGDIRVISIDAGNDDVILSAIGAIVGDGAVDVDVTAETLVINDAGNVGTGAGNLALTTDVENLDISGVSNSIYIHQNSAVAGSLRVDRVTNGDNSNGDVINIHSGQDAMVVGVINADSGLDDVVLSSDSNISDSNSDLNNVTASSLTIGEANNIGAADDVLETMIDSLLLNNVDADVYIKNLQALTIEEANSVGGSLDIESTGTLTVAGDVTVTGTSTVELRSTSANVNVGTNDSSAIVSSVNGTVTVTGVDVTLAGTGNFYGEISTGGGNVKIDASGAVLIGEDTSTDSRIYSGGSIDIDATTITINGLGMESIDSTSIVATGTITNNSDTSADTTLTIESDGDVINTSNGTLDAVDIVSITANQISQNGDIIVANGTVTLSSTTTITDTTATGGTIEADVLTIGGANGATGAGSAAVGADDAWLDTTVNTLDLGDRVVTGDVYILESNLLDVNAAAVNGNVDLETTSGNLNINGDLDVTSSAANSINLTAAADINVGTATTNTTVSVDDGNMTLTAVNVQIGDVANGNVAVLSVIGVAVGTGDIKIDASGDVTMNANSETQIRTTNGTIDIDSVNVTIDGLGLSAGSDVDVTANNAINILGTSTIQTTNAGSVNITADNDTSGVGDFIMADGTSIVAAGDGEAINITASNIVIDEITASGVNSSVGIIATGATGTINGDVAGINVTDITADNISLTAVAGIGTTGAIHLASATTVTATTTRDIIDLTHAADADSYLRFLTSGDTGDVTFKQTGDFDVNVGLVETASTATLSSEGAIEDFSAGDTTVTDITAATIKLDAVTGIGNVEELETIATTISADNTGSGSVDIDNAIAAAVSVTSLTTTGGGNILFDNTGAGGVTFGTVTADEDATPTDGEADITLTSTNGDMRSGAVMAGATSGDVSMTVTSGNLNIGAGADDSVNAGTTSGIVNYTTATGNIELTGTTNAGAAVNINSAGDIDGAGLVTTASANLDAVDGIGATTALELAASTIAADTTSGDIDIDNALATDVTVTSLSNTAGGDITFENSDGGNLAVANAAVTLGGNIAISQAGGGNMTVDTASTGASAAPTAGEAGITLDVDNGNLTIGTSVTALGMGDIKYETTTSGNILLTGTTTAANDAVAVTAVGTLNGAGLITAQDIALTGSTIGVSIPLEVDGTNIVLKATGGAGFSINVNGSDLDNALIISPDLGLGTDSNQLDILNHAVRHGGRYREFISETINGSEIYYPSFNVVHGLMVFSTIDNVVNGIHKDAIIDNLLGGMRKKSDLKVREKGGLMILSAR